MKSLLLKNGRVIDPGQGWDRVTNLLIRDGKIAAWDAPESLEDPEVDSIDASGLIVAPGLIDMHVELREPGHEEDETIESGTRAALCGGFTSIACLPNTDPPIDSQASVEFIRQKAARAGNCNVYVLACASRNREGEQLSEIGSLVEAGAVGITDASRSIQNSELLRRALQYCQTFNIPVMNHPEVAELTRGGVMHEGLHSMILGLSGMPAEAEDVMTSRDLRLAESTGGRIHLMNLSTRGSLELLKQARAKGVQATAEVNPVHFTLTDESLRSFDPHFKVRPPLRTREHIDACIEALADDTVQVISSCHTPRAPEKKLLEFNAAPFGMIGLETTLALVITQLIRPGHLSWMQALAKMTTGPASILGIDKGTLRVGAAADVTLIDPELQWTVQADQFHSQSRNTPFEQWSVFGRATATLVAGEIRYRLEQPIAP